MIVCACQYVLLSILIILHVQVKCEAQVGKGPQRRIEASSLNQKVVGLLLKANGKRYYVSSELCPGGVFLTRPVNENCLCYNGIFQIVRDCCKTRSTRINSDALEWRNDFKCGTSPEVGNSSSGRHPIRAIFPLSKPHSRFSSILTTRSLVGNNTIKWRKFDMEDIVIGNNAHVSMNGKTQFEIVNVKPLGREIRIMIGRTSNMAICYSGWLTDEGHQNLRVRVVKPGKWGETKDCCFNVTQASAIADAEIFANCSTGSIVAEIIDVQSADIDIGQCDQDIPEEAPHTINKRQLPTYQTVRLNRATNKLLKGARVNHGKSLINTDDLLGERGPILFKRSNINIIKKHRKRGEPRKSKGATTSTKTPKGNMTGSGNTTPFPEEPDRDKSFNAEGVILPRKKGINTESLYDQAQAINEFIAILRNDLNVEIREPQTPRFQLLRKSFDVFLNLVPTEVVPQVMIKTAFDVFYFLYEELEPILYEPPEMLTKTLHFLDKCMSHEKILNFSTTGCPKQIDELNLDPATKAKLEGCYKDQPDELSRVLSALKHVEIRKDKRYIVELHDIYVEINWKVADFVHSMCFDYFEKEINAHTYYETELEKLFLDDDVQRRWYSRAKNLRYVRGIFPVADLKLSMKQLDKVTAAAHYLSRYNGSYWLERPPKTDVPIFFPDNRKPNPNALQGAENSEARLIFVKNLIEDEKAQASQEKKQAVVSGRSGAAPVSSVERTVKYPFQYPDTLPAGELIWDGMAVCLHASYSTSKNYFFDADLWGVTPSLFELGQLYS